MILTQERPRTPFTVSIELLGECSTQNPNIFIPLNANITKYNNISAIIKNNSTDEVAQACALSLLPEDLAQRYPLTTMAGRDVSTYSDSDATVYGLLQWFKNEFFEFCDNPACPVCGGRMFTNGPVLMLSGNERVSYVFKCPKCIPISQNVCTGNFTPMGVLDARGGRLDEAVELFALFLQSLMLDVRIVVTDTWYKWVEVYSEVQRRWIHCDPTLGLFDSPLTYEKTWGDKASNPYCFKFCIAVGPDCELVDVSRRYTQDYSGLVRARAESGITERNRLVVLRMREFVNGLKLNEPNLDTLRKVIERQNEEIRQLTSGNNKTLYGEAIDPQQNRYLRPRCDNSVHVLGEWLEAQSIEKPLFSHTDFSRAHDVWTAGSAIKIPQRKAPLVLTTNNTNKVGAAWVVVDKAKVLEKGFFTSFDFTILYPGADGFAFVVQGLGPGVFGNGGCQIGYGGLHHSVAVEFDNYLSQSECNDPSPLHVGVNTMYESPNTADHGRAGLGATSAVPQFANGAVHSVGIAFRNRTVLVWMDSVLILTVTDCNLDRVLKGRDGCWVGFTAATGGLSQQHNIESWSLSYFN